MHKETKDVLYMLLDILDSMHKTSKGNNLFDIDETKLKIIKKEIFDIIKNIDIENNEKAPDKKAELIGILPSVLVDLSKFPNNEDLNKLAESSLNFQIPFWRKRSRHEIIGRIITEIDNKEGEEFDMFFNAWKEFVKIDKKDSDVRDKKNFVNIWLEFFDHYKGR
jgi:hypothetical protein